MIKNKPVIGIIPTYNLTNEANDPYADRASFVRMYEEKITKSGGIAIGLLSQNITDYLSICDGYVWPGGTKIWPDFFPVIEDAIKNKKPLLGVCLGMQAIATYFNLVDANKSNPDLKQEDLIKLLKDTDYYVRVLKDPSNHNFNVTKESSTIVAARHEINVLKDSLLYSIYGKEKMQVVSLHSYVVPNICDTLKVTAKALDNVNECVEYTKDGALIIGLQFHPEIESDSLVFEWLIHACYNKSMILVNKENAIPASYEPKIVRYNSKYPECINDGDIALMAYDAWLSLKEEMHKRGFNIDVESAYRPHALQEKIFNENKEKYGIEHTLIFVAKPGYSEHETGLAIDICLEKDGRWYNEFAPEFTECYKVLHEICANYGFILRYPEGKEEITGYHYEPWHLRYLGDINVCKEIMTSSSTLEEYYLKKNKSKNI